MSGYLPQEARWMPVTAIVQLFTYFTEKIRGCQSIELFTFVLFLYIQQINKISLRASAVSASAELVFVHIHMYLLYVDGPVAIIVLLNWIQVAQLQLDCVA